MTIFGMGTGRCGTTSLVGLCRLQDSAHATHQFKRWKWQGANQYVLDCAAEVHARDADLRVDVAVFWLPYVHSVAAFNREAKFVCLKRPRAEYVESWCKFRGFRNAWCVESGPDLAYPQTGLLDAAVSAGLYWDFYNGIADQMAAELPGRFRVVDMDALNDEAKQRELLTWMGVADPHTEPGIQLNTRNDDFGQRLRGYPMR